MPDVETSDTAPTSLRVWRYSDGAVRTGGVELIEGDDGYVWIDCEHPDEATLERLALRFELHRLAVEDCLHLDQRPKLEEYPGHVFLVLQSFTCADGPGIDVTLHELHFFIGERFLITVHERAHAAIAATARRIQVAPSETMGRGLDFVAYLLADALVDWNFPLLDRIGDVLDELEGAILEHPSRDLMGRAYALRHTLVVLRRVLAPQRDVVGLLARRGVPHVSDRTVLFFRDVYDHLVRIAEQLEATRDLVASIMDMYLAVLANRTSDVSKQLTLFASIFMPMSFVVGFFGQNFDGIAPASLFWPMLLILGSLPLGMLAWFKHKSWL